MIPNNFNILPVYSALSEQNARQWWVYGKIYPLFSPLNRVPPFQIKRVHLPAPVEPDEVFADSEIDNTGNVVTGTGEVWRFDVSEGDAFSIRNVIGEGVAVDRLSIAILDGDDTLLFSRRETTPENFNDFEVPADAVVLYVYADSSTFVFREGDEGTADLFYDLYSADGSLIESNGVADVKIITKSGYDYLVSALFLISGHEEGQYYLRLYDGVNVWYTDVFTWVQNYHRLICLEWWDDADFVMDDGEILYDLGGGLKYVNSLYLKAEIAKPTYPFEEEGETRDGRFFPVKMISSKQYHFNFLAPEYLLDVLRFVRMADHVEITDYYFTDSGEVLSHTYRPETILFTPEWEAEGDLAAVSVEFQTDTFAKKINFIR